jgi:hypothetical protein
VNWRSGEIVESPFCKEDRISAGESIEEGSDFLWEEDAFDISILLEFLFLELNH